MPKPRRSSKPYTTNKPFSEHGRFLGQDEKADVGVAGKDGGLKISFRECARLKKLRTGLAESLCMHPAQALWFSLIFCVRNLPEILATRPAERRKLSEQGFMTGASVPKAERCGEKGWRRFIALREALELPNSTSTVRFATAYTCKRIDRILEQGLDKEIRQNAKQAFNDLEDSDVLYVKNFDFPSSSGVIEALASGRDLRELFDFPGLSEEDIREIAVSMVQEEARLGGLGRMRDQEQARWGAPLGISEAVYEIDRLQNCFAEYTWIDYPHFSEQEVREFVGKFIGRVVGLRKDIETEVGRHADVRSAVRKDRQLKRRR
jgi:hypothetical protein